MHKYQDKNLSADERTEDLLSLMTLEEKVMQMMQISYQEFGGKNEKYLEWKKKAVGSYLHVFGEEADEVREYAKQTRLQIPPILGIDAIHGHALLNGATVFPSQLSMSSSWDCELINKMGQAVAREVCADKLDWAFSPVLCVARDQRWGRTNETFGEDPYLIGEFGKAIIDGYQKDNYIIATAKHFLAYGESTGGRDAYDSPVSYRKARELFLEPFRKAVNAGVKSFMTGYQSIDALPATADKKLLTDILRGELGYEGFVVTDWMNIRSLVNKQFIAENIEDATYMALDAGNDMSMNVADFYDAAISLVKNGRLDISVIDNAVRHILRVKFALGLFDEKQRPPREIIACEEHKKINLAITQQSMVLLKNENHCLPICKNVKSIAVVGPNADDLKAQFGHWTFFTLPEENFDAVPINETYTMLDGIKKVFSNSEVIYEKGCSCINEDSDNIEKAVNAAKKADVIVAVVGDNLSQNGECNDRAEGILGGRQLKLLSELKKLGKPLACVLVNSKPLCIGWLKENCDAIVETFNSGDLGGLALAQLLAGEFNPSGKLTISFPHSPAQLPVYYNHYAGWHGIKHYTDLPEGVVYAFGEGISYTDYKYDNLKISKKEVAKTDEITVSVDVTNIGKIDGNEIVQLYINDVVSSVMTPMKQLMGFKKVHIKAGETKTVEIPLKISDIFIVDHNENYIVEPGTVDIMVGKSSIELLTDKITIL